jgi:DNA invertase Pin-like site-specific DNA recombinase
LSGYDLVSVSEDAGISGSKGEDKRPGLAEALAAIRDGRAEVLIVTHADRLARSIDETGHVRVEVKRAGGRVDVISEVKDDPVRHAVDQMLAELERIRGSQRMASWNAARKAKGLPAGPPPFGYRLGEDGRLVADEAQRATVNRVLRLRRRGKTLRAIADAMNTEKIPAPRAGKWNAMTVSLILKRESGGRG